MVEEIEGIQRGYMDMLLEKKMFIAEMPHLFESEKNQNNHKCSRCGTVYDPFDPELANLREFKCNKCGTVYDPYDEDMKDKEKGKCTNCGKPTEQNEKQDPKGKCPGCGKPMDPSEKIGGYSLLNKRLAFRLRLKSPDEDFFTSEEYWNSPNSMTYLKERERALYATEVKGSFNIAKRLHHRWRKGQIQKKLGMEELGVGELDRSWRGNLKIDKDTKKELKQEAKASGTTLKKDDLISAQKEKGVEKLKEKGYSPALQISAFVVKENEFCLFYQQGRLIGEVPSGLWVVEPRYQTTGTEIIWIDKSQFQFKWGVGNVYTADFFKVGAHGKSIVQVRDPKKFVLNMMSSKKTIDQGEVEQFIESTLNGSIKNELNKQQSLNLVRARDELIAGIRSNMSEMLDRWGFELVNLEVAGFALPPELEATIKAQMQASKFSLEQMAERAKMTAGTETDLLATTHDKTLKMAKASSMEGDMAMKEMEIRMRMMEKKAQAQEKLVDQDVEAAGLDVHAKRLSIDKTYDLAYQKQLQDQEARMMGSFNDRAGLQRDGTFDQRSAFELKKGSMDYDIRSKQIDADKDVGMKWGTDVRVAQAAGNTTWMNKDYDARMKGMELDAKVKVAQTMAGGGVGGVGIGGAKTRIAELEREINEREAFLTALSDQLANNRISPRMFDEQATMIKQRVQQMQDELKALKTQYMV